MIDIVKNLEADERKFIGFVYAPSISKIATW